MGNVIYWCEFPETVNWKSLQKLLERLDYKIIIYVPCKSMPQYIWWKQELKRACQNIKEVNVWPILGKEEGYWFSGFTELYSIDKLDEFNGEKMKIDLEVPIPRYNYSLLNMARYALKYIFRKAPNANYLANKILNLNKDSDIIVNEFPLPKFILKRWGCYIEPRKGIRKNIMCYSTLFTRCYAKHIMRKAVRENKDVSVSIGLIGHGILKTEPAYRSIRQLEKDIQTAKNLGVKNIAVYSIDSIMSKEEPEPWLRAVREF